MLDFVLAVQGDAYTYTGAPARMTAFENFFCRSLDVSKLERRSLSVMGCSVNQVNDYSITLNQSQKLHEVDPYILINSFLDSKDGLASSSNQPEIYRRIIGQMLYIDRLSAPLMLNHASAAATKLPDLRRNHLRDLASTVTCLKQQGLVLKLLSPPSAPSGGTTSVPDCISDGATATGTDIRGREGHIMFRRLRVIVHPILWSSRKLRRVSRSSSIAETLAVANEFSNTLYMHSILEDMVGSPPTAEQTVDSTSLQSLSISTSPRNGQTRSTWPRSAKRTTWDTPEPSMVPRDEVTGRPAHQG